MAGNYPDAPSNRMLLDRDGAQFYKISHANVVTQLGSSDIAAINDESNGGISGFTPGIGTCRLLVYFPELRNLAGYFLATSCLVPISHKMAVSTNTTNGMDGTWTQLGTDLAIGAQEFAPPVSPTFRTGIVTVSATGIRGVRFSVDRTASSPSVTDIIHAFHLYGNIAAGQNPNRLAVWHPTSDAHISGAYYDWGDVPRSSSADRTCRIKNMSSTLTAHAITVAFNALTDTTPSVPGQFLVSDDGVTFDATADIGDLAPGGISPILTVRRNTPTNAELSVWEPRIVAAATSWS